VCRALRLCSREFPCNVSHPCFRVARVLSIAWPYLGTPVLCPNCKETALLALQIGSYPVIPVRPKAPFALGWLTSCLGRRLGDQGLEAVTKLVHYDRECGFCSTSKSITTLRRHHKLLMWLHSGRFIPPREPRDGFVTASLGCVLDPKGLCFGCRAQRGAQEPIALAAASSQKLHPARTPRSVLRGSCFGGPIMGESGPIWERFSPPPRSTAGRARHPQAYDRHDLG
jgi:hypothetical protein